MRNKLSPISRHVQFAMACACVALLAGCSSLRIGTEGIKAFYCGTDTKPGAYVPVRWSQRDTDETIAQTKANNAVWVDTCR